MRLPSGNAARRPGGAQRIECVDARGRGARRRFRRRPGGSWPMRNGMGGVFVAHGRDVQGVAADGQPLPTCALARESGRARRLLAAGQWRPARADAEAAAAVLARLAAPLPARRPATARVRAADRDRRLQRILRTALHHLDAGAVSPPAAVLPAGVARALLPWYAVPSPSAAAAAPRYGRAPGASADAVAPPTGAGEALLPGLVELFAALAAAGPSAAGGAGVRGRGRPVGGGLRLAPGRPGLLLRGGEPQPRPRPLRGVAPAAGCVTGHSRPPVRGGRGAPRGPLTRSRVTETPGHGGACRAAGVRLDREIEHPF